MGTVIRVIIRSIIGVAVMLIGLAIAGLSIYTIIQGSSQWWNWLGFICFGIAITGAGLLLLTHGFKSFAEAIASFIAPVP